MLTAAQGPHLSVLRVHLRDVCHPLAQHVHWDLVAVLVLPVGRLIARPLHLGPAVGWGQRSREWVNAANCGSRYFTNPMTRLSDIQSAIRPGVITRNRALLFRGGYAGKKNCMLKLTKRLNQCIYIIMGLGHMENALIQESWDILH